MFSFDKPMSLKKLNMLLIDSLYSLALLQLFRQFNNPRMDWDITVRSAVFNFAKVKRSNDI